MKKWLFSVIAMLSLTSNDTFSSEYLRGRYIVPPVALAALGGYHFGFRRPAQVKHAQDLIKQEVLKDIYFGKLLLEIIHTSFPYDASYKQSLFDAAWAALNRSLNNNTRDRIVKKTDYLAQAFINYAGDQIKAFSGLSHTNYLLNLSNALTGDNTKPGIASYLSIPMQTKAYLEASREILSSRLIALKPEAQVFIITRILTQISSLRKYYSQWGVLEAYTKWDILGTLKGLKNTLRSTLTDDKRALSKNINDIISAIDSIINSKWVQ